MKKELRFSLCLPVYNGAQVIGPTLKSILGQSFTNFELIIIDDCSQDRTEAVVKQFRDKRIKFFKNQRNLGYSGNLEKCRQKAKGEIIYLMGQDDILGEDALLNTHQVFFDSPQVGAVTRPYYWFDQVVAEAVRAKKQLNPHKNELITLCSPREKILLMFATLDQLSGLAYRKKFMDLPFHQDIFPCHVYPFASIFKNHPVVFLKDYNVAVRIGSSQTRGLSSIYERSPLLSWVEMFTNVFHEKKHSCFRSFMIKEFVATNYVGLVQIKNYSTAKNLFREIFYLVRYRPENLLNFGFWFFALGTIIVPGKILIPLVDNFKNKVLAHSLKKVKMKL